MKISHLPNYGFSLRFGFVPHRLNTEQSKCDEAMDDTPFTTISNPHMIIRQHLEELLNSTKCIYTLGLVSIYLQYVKFEKFFKLLISLTIK